MLRNRIQKNWFFIAITALVFWFIFTYQSAWQWGVIDTYSLVERLLDPHYLLNDFYTNSLTGFSARYFVARFFVLGASVFHIPYQEFVGYLNVLRLVLTEVLLFIFFRQ